MNVNEYAIAVSGNGVMGRLAARQLESSAGSQPTAATAPDEFTLRFAGCMGPGDFNSLEAIPGPIHGIIDFSHPDFLPAIVRYVSCHPVPLVIATTGYSDEQVRQIHDLSKQVPVVFSSNFSPGIAILSRILREVSPLLSGWDVEIVEMHHNRKLDAPSGTALALADAIDGQNNLPRLAGRSGNGRRGQEIGFHSIRCGSVSGKHDVIFAGPDEILTFSHQAQDRSLFAHGAVLAMKFALRQEHPGLFSMEDVLFG